MKNFWKNPISALLCMVVLIGSLYLAADYGMNKSEAIATGTEIQPLIRPVFILVTEAKGEVEEVIKEPEEEPEMVDLSIEDQIRQVAEQFEVSPELAIAISQYETGYYTSKAFLSYNNLGGLSHGDGSLIKYASFEDGLYAFIELIANYNDKGYETPEEIAKRWCPVNEANWAWSVRTLMEAQED